VANISPADIASLRITEGIRHADLDENHVCANMGPMIVRGMWFPFLRLGL
jgi:hypothetical protein